ncbi:1,2-phenylacetyl-CoA epoxidase subunit PaaC [Micrococcoides hystricis]|uniref:1,2-phenylacetyl-CoA epoxidase subunit PaaC n=1 Tax=Micrococcoides hystricis TaxID=1572761 RepID=A0ABV6PBD1_9MICC
MTDVDNLESFGDSAASATRVTPGFALRPEDIAVADAKPANQAVADYAMALGDDALIMGQRLSEWVSRAPEMEEDIALANVALDLLGHARSFLTYAGRFSDKTEDDLAYFRDEEEFRCLHIVQHPRGDFGRTIARMYLFGLYQELLYTALLGSEDKMIAAIAEKSLKEVAYHRDHAEMWIQRLAGGTEESKKRLEAGFAYDWPYVNEMFTDWDELDQLEGVAVRPSTLRAEFDERLNALFDENGLTAPQIPPSWGGGRKGEPSEYLGYILAEMQSLARKHPGATW